MQERCPSRVLFVQSPKMLRAAGREPWSLSGKINGKQVDNMLLDTGAAITVVSEDIIPRETKNGNTIALRGLRPGITMFDLADVQLDLGGGKIDLEVAVAPSGTLTHPALIGRDVPGMEFTMKLNQETQDVLPCSDDQGSNQKRTRKTSS